MSLGHRWQGQQVTSLKKKTLVTPHLLFSWPLALPSISDIVPGQQDLRLHLMGKF